MDLIRGFWYYTDERLEQVVSHLPGLRYLGYVKCTKIGEDLLSLFSIESSGLLNSDILCELGALLLTNYCTCLLFKCEFLLLHSTQYDHNRFQ